VPETAVLDRIVGSFNSSPSVARLVQDGLLELHVYAVVGDSIFDPVLDIERVASVSRIVQRVIECVSRPLYSDFEPYITLESR
jgi:hypothetical protein